MCVCVCVCVCVCRCVCVCVCVGVFSFHWVGRPDSVQGRTRKVGGAGAVSAAVTAMQINAGPRNPTRNITVLLESRKSASDNIVQYTKVFFFLVKTLCPVPHVSLKLNSQHSRIE